MPTAERERRFKALVASIRKLTKEHKVPPTMRELAADLKRSVSPVYKDLRSLEKEGRVTWENGKGRTIRVVR